MQNAGDAGVSRFSRLSSKIDFGAGGLPFHTLAEGGHMSPVGFLRPGCEGLARKGGVFIVGFAFDKI